MTVPEAIAHEKLIAHFGAQPFSTAEAQRRGIAEATLTALCDQGVLAMQAGRYQVVQAEDFVELERSLKGEREFMQRWPLLRHTWEVVELCG